MTHWLLHAEIISSFSAANSFCPILTNHLQKTPKKKKVRGPRLDLIHFCLKEKYQSSCKENSFKTSFLRLPVYLLNVCQMPKCIKKSSITLKPPTYNTTVKITLVPPKQPWLVKVYCRLHKLQPSCIRFVCPAHPTNPLGQFEIWGFRGSIHHLVMYNKTHYLAESDHCH